MFKIIQDVVGFIRHIIQSRDLLFTLAYSDFKEKYAGSYLGMVWAVLRPSIFVLTIWGIFSIGFKKDLLGTDIPFAVYLICGYVPWFFFSEAVMGGMNSITDNKFLVQKVAFRVSVLPLSRILSAFYLHVALLGLLMLILLYYGYTPTIYWLQLPYYTACLMILLLGIGWLTSAIRVFVKDATEIMSVLLQLGFWATPIFWSIQLVPAQYQILVKLNPMVYIIEGYRNTFIYGVWFWEHHAMTPYFLVVTSVILMVGIMTFKQLRPYFGDAIR